MTARTPVSFDVRRSMLDVSFSLPNRPCLRLKHWRRLEPNGCFVVRNLPESSIADPSSVAGTAEGGWTRIQKDFYPVQLS